MTSLPKARVNLAKMTAQIGNVHKGFATVNLIQVPAYTRKIKERNCLGNGWYSGNKMVDRVFDNDYLLEYDDKIVGVIYSLYIGFSQMSNDVFPATTVKVAEIKKLIQQLGKPVGTLKDVTYVLPSVLKH